MVFQQPRSGTRRTPRRTVSSSCVCSRLVPSPVPVIDPWKGEVLACRMSSPNLALGASTPTALWSAPSNASTKESRWSSSAPNAPLRFVYSRMPRGGDLCRGKCPGKLERLHRPQPPDGNDLSTDPGAKAASRGELRPSRPERRKLIGRTVPRVPVFTSGSCPLRPSTPAVTGGCRSGIPSRPGGLPARCDDSESWMGWENSDL